MYESPHSSGVPGSGPISHSVERLRREFDRWLEAALEQGNRALDAIGLRGPERPWSPSIDLVETPTEVQVDVDLPGIEPGLVDVSLLGNMLTIRVPRKTSLIPDGAVAHLTERTQGPCQRSIPMPAPIIAETVAAELKNGVLRLRLQKSEKARPMKIPVRTEATAVHVSEPWAPAQGTSL